MKNEEYRFLAATKINQDGVDCKRAIDKNNTKEENPTILT
jgi:hypothetical protein